MSILFALLVCLCDDDLLWDLYIVVPESYYGYWILLPLNSDSANDFSIL